MTIPAWLDASFTPMVDATVRGAIILLAVLIATHLLRRRSAAARHALWAGAVCAQLLLVVWAVAGPQWSVAIPTAVDAVLPALAAPQPVITQTVQAPAVRPSPRADDGVQQHPGRAASTTDTKSPSAPVAPVVREASVPDAGPPPVTSATRAPLSWRAILLVVWALGAAIVLLRLAVGTMIVAALARRGARVDDGHWLAQAQRIAGALGISRPLTLLRGDRVGVPITWGIVYPVVLLPADADAWPDERRQFVLVHEMAHVKRLDALTQLVGQLVLALFWFNPLVWIANRRMQLEREHACDDYVLRHGTSASHYAEQLLAMVRSLGTANRSGVQPAFAALAMARRSEFEGRMLSILDPALSRRPLSRARGAIGVLASLLVVVPLAALRPYHRATPVERHAGADTGRAINPETGGEFPTSFKVHIEPDTGDALGAQGAQPALGSLAAGMAALATSVTKSDSALTSVQRSLAHTATTSPKSCDDEVVRGTVIRSIHSDEDDDGSSSVHYLNVNDDHCTETRLIGKVTFNDDETGIVTMAPDAVAVFRERIGDQRRELIVRPNGSALSYTYTRNGAAAPFDAGAQAWFASMVQTTLREGAVNVAPRVARIRKQGGVDAVLKMIAGIQSSGSKRAHYLALLNEGGLTSAEGDRLVRQVAHDVPSSGDLRAVLIAAAPLVRDQSRSASALEQAAAAVPSSGDRTAVLAAFGETGNHEMLLSVMKMAATIPSSGDKARLLSELTVRYFEGGDTDLRDAYFRTLGTIPSSGDMRRVLMGVLSGYGAAQPVALDVITASNAVASSGDRAAVLLGVANSGALRDAKVREAYLDAAQRLAPGDANRVLAAAARR